MNVAKRPVTWFVLPLLLLPLLAAPAAAQNADGVAGKWRTEMEGPGGKIVLILQLQQDATGRWLATLKNNRAPDQIGEGKGVAVDGTRVTFYTEDRVPQMDATLRSEFDLKLRPVEDKLKGSIMVKMPGMEREQPMEFSRIVEKAGAAEISYQASRPFIGEWRTRPDDDDKEREIQLEILPDGDAYQGTLTDTGIDQTVALRDLAAKDTSVSFNFRFDGAPFMSSFWGRYDPERDELRGSMSIGGRSQPMYFERTSPGPDDVADEFGTEKKPLPKKHDARFAASARLAYWAPMYVMKDEVRNINDITTTSMGFDLGARFYLVDYLALQARYVRGGVGFDTNEKNLGLFDPVTGSQGGGMSAALGTDSYLAMNGFEFTVVGYLGQHISPNSRFNPYIIGSIGITDWELTEGERGTDIVSIYEEDLTGSDWTFGGGLGTEYAIGEHLGLEFEWLWTYTTCEDETKWEDITYQWTNQHVHRISLGAIWWF